MTEHEQQTLWLGAFRYYLGNNCLPPGFSVSDFCRILLANWQNLPESVQKRIRIELYLAKISDDRDEMFSPNFRGYRQLGYDCDRAEWLKVMGVIDGQN